MLNKEKIFFKIDLLNGYLEELEKVKPLTLDEFEGTIEKKRSCERLLQISIETVIDICAMFVSNLGLGLPSDEETMLEKLEGRKVLSIKMKNTLKEMVGFRNILVHKYGEVKDEKSFENLS